MTYFYHRVPEGMEGDILYPLNTLREIYPEVYKKAVSKYVDREEILLDTIPILNCLWNDALHFSPVHPALIKEALFEAGNTNSFNFDFFEIDSNLFDPEKTVVYLNQYPYRDKYTEGNFVEFNPKNIEHLRAVPEQAKQYYKYMYSQGKTPLLYGRIPHVLYKGSIDVRGLKRISV